VFDLGVAYFTAIATSGIICSATQKATLHAECGRSRDYSERFTTDVGQFLTYYFMKCRWIKFNTTSFNLVLWYSYVDRRLLRLYTVIKLTCRKCTHSQCFLCIRWCVWANLCNMFIFADRTLVSSWKKNHPALEAPNGGIMVGEVSPSLNKRSNQGSPSRRWIFQYEKKPLSGIRILRAFDVVYTQ
jgi:hypothetical protein